MIHDHARPPRPSPRDWAVWRYGLISEAARPLADEAVAQVLARIAARQHQLPDGSLRRFSAATLRGWLKSYQHGGLDALVPKTRVDKGSFRSLDEDSAEIIARHRVQHRELSVKLFHEILHSDAVLPAGVRVCEATLRRFLKVRGLDKPLRGPSRARAKYEMPNPNDLWVADFMHGPKVRTPQGQRRAILCAILDDHSRVAVGARFAFSEETADILHTLRDAIGAYGCPKRFYCDCVTGNTMKRVLPGVARSAMPGRTLFIMWSTALCEACVVIPLDLLATSEIGREAEGCSFT